MSQARANDTIKVLGNFIHDNLRFFQLIQPEQEAKKSSGFLAGFFSKRKDDDESHRKVVIDLQKVEKVVIDLHKVEKVAGGFKDNYASKDVYIKHLANLFNGMLVTAANLTEEGRKLEISLDIFLGTYRVWLRNNKDNARKNILTFLSNRSKEDFQQIKNIKKSLFAEINQAIKNYTATKKSSLAQGAIEDAQSEIHFEEKIASSFVDSQSGAQLFFSDCYQELKKQQDIYKVYNKIHEIKLQREYSFLAKSLESLLTIIESDYITNESANEKRSGMHGKLVDEIGKLYKGLKNTSGASITTLDYEYNVTWPQLPRRLEIVLEFAQTLVQQPNIKQVFLENKEEGTIARKFNN